MSSVVVKQNQVRFCPEAGLPTKKMKGNNVAIIFLLGVNSFFKAFVLVFSFISSRSF